MVDVPKTQPLSRKIKNLLIALVLIELLILKWHGDGMVGTPKTSSSKKKTKIRKIITTKETIANLTKLLNNRNNDHLKHIRKFGDRFLTPRSNH